MLVLFNKVKTFFICAHLRWRASQGHPASKLVLSLLSKEIDSFIVYGGGVICTDFLTICSTLPCRFNIDCIIDKKAEHQSFEIKGIPVLPPSTLKKNKHTTLIVASARYIGEIIETIETFKCVQNCEIVTVLNSEY